MGIGDPRTGTLGDTAPRGQIRTEVNASLRSRSGITYPGMVSLPLRWSSSGSSKSAVLWDLTQA